MSIPAQIGHPFRCERAGSHEFFKTIDIPFQQLINQLTDVLALLPRKILEFALQLGLEVELFGINLSIEVNSTAEGLVVEPFAARPDRSSMVQATAQGARMPGHPCRR